MSDWKTYKLGETGKIITGKTPPTINPEYFGEKYPFITPRDMNTQKYIRNTERYLSENGKLHLKNNLLPKRSICVSCIGSDLGKVVMTTEDSFTNQQLNAIICSDKFDSDFIYYSSLIVSDKLRSIGKSSTAVPIVNKSQFSEFEIQAPEAKTEQQQIAQILSSLDDKIELNLQMNQTLEAMAQAIFKEWFVNFNFPGFDGELVDGLPKGWQKVEISKLISVKDGTHDSPKQTENGKYLITSKHLKNHFIDFESAYRISEDDFEKINKRSKVDKLDVLITMIGTVGNLYFVHDEVMNFAIKNIGLFKTSEKPDLAYFLYFSISSKEITDYFIKRLAGSTQQYLTLDTLRQTPIVFPDDETLKLFSDIAESIYSKIELNSQNIQSLTQTRDTLLPKLMSGQLEIKS